jgi:hypothetical protein
MHTPTRRARRIALAAGGLGLAVALGAGPLGAPAPAGGAPATVGEAAATSAAGRLPETPQAYATAAFRAWLRGNDARLSRLATPAVAHFLLARAPEDTAGWSRPACEGAAGSTYCAWDRSETRLVIRVANEAVAGGQPHAVVEAFFDVAGTNVAIWPLTTAEQATNTQAQVDEGHSPWMLDPAAVASFYASAVLGWQDATVREDQPSTYVVTDPASGARALLVLAQPARQGEGGIWAVTRAGSTA